jgi:hypothetical protein
VYCEGGTIVLQGCYKGVTMAWMMLPLVYACYAPYATWLRGKERHHGRRPCLCNKGVTRVLQGCYKSMMVYDITLTYVVMLFVRVFRVISLRL